MKCVYCGGNTKVISTRKRRNGRPYRRRVCLDCKERFTTHEINEVDLLNMLDEYLPERLVDEISHEISNGFSNNTKEKRILG